MAGAKFKILTSLSASDLAQEFRAAADQPAGFINKLALQWEFFTPEPDSDPFAAVSGDNSPTFEVGARYSLRKGKIRINTDAARYYRDGTNGEITMAVWDRGPQREVRLLHYGNRNPASRKVVKEIMRRWQTQDPSASVEKK